MKIAYADPPYFGCGKRLYGDLHEDASECDTREFHFELVQRLVTEFPDGWALSCNPSDLAFMLPIMPDDVRVSPWCKTWHRIRPNVSVQYAWEPLIWRGGRAIKRRNPMVRDWLACPVTLQRTVKGAKPDAFCMWMFRLLGLQPDDEFHDLFPGSFAVTDAWKAFTSQMTLPSRKADE